MLEHFRPHGPLDAAVITFRGIAIYLGDGTGHLSGPQYYQMPNGFAHSILGADVDRDGLPDVIVAGNDTFSGFFETGVLKSRGDGTFLWGFAELQGLSQPHNQSWFTTADLRNDGNVDVVTAVGTLYINCWRGACDHGQVLLGDPDGSLQPPLIITLEQRPQDNEPSEAFAVGVGDFDGDGRADVAFESITNNNPPVTTWNVIVLSGRGDGAFDPNTEVRVGVKDGGLGMVVDDFNGDGRLDIAVVQAESGIDILLNATPRR